MTEASVVQGPIKNVIREEMAIAIKVMKPGKTAGPSEVCAEMISAIGKIWVSVMMKLCQRVLNGKQVYWYQFSRRKEMYETAIFTEE